MVDLIKLLSGQTRGPTICCGESKGRGIRKGGRRRWADGRDKTTIRRRRGVASLGGGDSFAFLFAEKRLKFTRFTYELLLLHFDIIFDLNYSYSVAIKQGPQEGSN